jgi:hypothetical protein
VDLSRRIIRTNTGMITINPAEWSAA